MRMTLVPWPSMRAPQAMRKRARSTTSGSRAVHKDGFSIGQCGCHEQVFRTADGGKVEMDVRAVELAAAAENIPVLKIEPRPHLFEG